VQKRWRRRMRFVGRPLLDIFGTSKETFIMQCERRYAVTGLVNTKKNEEVFTQLFMLFRG
jgi:hypothetical protein